MVYKRGRDKEKNIFVSYGSKAWTIKYLHTASYKKQIFVDDGLDHINSVKNMLTLLPKYKNQLSTIHVENPEIINLPLILLNWIN